MCWRACKEAIREFETAAKLAPEQPDVHFGLGYLYWKQHDYDHATAEFQQEIQLGGSVAKSEAYLGDIALMEQKEDQARALLKQALRLFADIRIAHYDLGILDSKHGQYREASRTIRAERDRRYLLCCNNGFTLRLEDNRAGPPRIAQQTSMGEK